MAKRKPREGSLLRIDLGDETYAYARVLPNSQVAIYDTRTSQSDIDLSTVFGTAILWKLTVMKSVLISGRWAEVNYRPLEEELTRAVHYFVRDRLTGRYSIYRSSDGMTSESTYDECKGLEAAAVWEAEHVEDRIRDYFAGRTNVWVEQLKPVPSTEKQKGSATN